MHSGGELAVIQQVVPVLENRVNRLIKNSLLVGPDNIMLSDLGYQLAHQGYYPPEIVVTADHRGIVDLVIKFQSNLLIFDVRYYGINLPWGLPLELYGRVDNHLRGVAIVGEDLTMYSRNGEGDENALRRLSQFVGEIHSPQGHRHWEPPLPPKYDVVLLDATRINGDGLGYDVLRLFTDKHQKFNKD